MQVYSRMPSPLGELLLTAEEGALTGVWFEGQRQPCGERDDAALAEARRQLQAWFEGRIRVFDLALAPQGTPFQLQVWDEIRRIPFGSTRSYGEVACRLGRPGASRAVGGATGRNPLSIVVPCHRVVGAGGSLTGYGGGLERKRFLLELEGIPIR